MATTVRSSRVRPAPTADYREPSKPRTVGIVLATVGLILALVTLIANIVVGTGNADPASTLPWSFGLTTTAFGTIKLAIGIVLWGILMKLWLRVDSIKAALPQLLPADRDQSPAKTGEIETPYGTATVGTGVPEDLPIHKMAKNMWLPMLAMGYMAVLVGLVIAFVWASNGSVVASAWTQGLQFLGEGMLLSGISFLLGTILWAIRTGGGEVQAGLGVPVKTLKMPASAKVFVALMMLGLMVSVVQFILYLVVAAGVDNVPAWFAWLGPFREFGLAMILSGITMALVAIGTALQFQFDRIVELVRHGR